MSFEYSLNQRSLVEVAIKQIRHGIIIYDRDLIVLEINLSARELLNIPEANFAIGEPFEKLVRAYAEQGGYDGDGSVEERVATRMAEVRTFSPFRKDIQQPFSGKHIEINGKPVSDQGYVTTYTDISDRIVAEQSARDSKSMYQQLIETTKEGYWYIDPNGATVNVNRAMCETLGRSREEFFGKTVFDFVDEANAEILRAELVRREQNIFETYEVAFKHSDGTNVPFLLNPTPIFDENHVHIGSVGLLTDISYIKESARKLEMANKTKSEFLATMSHEIRTPMTGVMGFADMLLDDELPEESRSKLFKIKDATRALLTILNDILDISKLEAGKMEVEAIDFHVASLIGQALNLFGEKRSGNRRKNLKLELSLSDDFPEAIKGDPTRLRQVMINLIGNAVKFTDEGNIRVDGGFDQSGDGQSFLRFAVHDTGIGMSAETIAKLFIDFSQADASISREFEGSGLGLAISKRLVELMGGKIGVESEPGEGSTFWFTLPYIEATTEVDQYVSASKAHAEEIGATLSLQILVAEDNAVNQMIIARVLETFGHTFDMVSNGAEAVKAHEAGTYDMVLMDVRMPKISGPDATKKIRQMDGRKGQIPIVALTADAMAEHQKGYFKAGMNAVVTKPIDRRELAAAINDAMGREIHTFEARNVATESVEESEEANAAVTNFLSEIGVSLEDAKPDSTS